MGDFRKFRDNLFLGVAMTTMMAAHPALAQQGSPANDTGVLVVSLRRLIALRMRLSLAEPPISC